MRFQVGDIVKISKKSKYYGAGRANPEDITGVILVTNIRSTRLPIRVEWDNGRRNTYGERDLRLYERPE